jgi:hypothetical protein
MKKSVFQLPRQNAAAGATGKCFFIDIQGG